MINWLRRLFSRRPTPGSSASTEFCAEVVRVTAIEPHGNADKLEIARFEMASTGPSGYPVVVRKGDYAVGALACYFSVDCLLPLKDPAFAFLKSANSTREVHRLRAARLRGVFSQGLLVPAPGKLKYGDSVAILFGVTYHSDEEPEAAAPGAKKPRPQAMPVYGVASLKKAASMFAAGEDVVITEKIHGTNVRFGWVRRRWLGVPVGWKFVVGSHRVIKGGPTGDHFYGEDVWLHAAVKHDLAERTRGQRGCAFYGELFGHTSTGKRIQDLTYGTDPEAGPQLVLFDVRTGGGWLSYDEFRALALRLGLEPAPLLHRGAYDPAVVAELAEGRSTLPGAEKQIREGCVVATRDGARKAKYVGQGYLLRKVADE